MYHILIVDDEKIERRGLCFLLNRMEESFVIEEAANGREALELLGRKTFDMMLTDVKMPFMDGIQLIEEAVKLDDEMKIMIFSGYGEFEYAKKALVLGVIDYMLKPVEPEEFEQLITKMIKQIESRKSSRAILRSGLNYVKEHALYGLINGKSMEEIYRESGELEAVREFEDIRYLLLMETDQEFFGRAGIDFKREMQQLAGEESMYLNLNPQQSVLLLKWEEQRETKKLAAAVVNYLQDKYAQPCFVAAPERIKIPGGGILKAYEEAETLMENRFYQPQQRIYGWEGEGERSAGELADDDTLMKQMKQDIRMHDIPGLREHFAALCRKYENQTDFSQVYIKFIFSNLLKEFYQSMPRNREGKLNDEITRLYEATDFKSVKDMVSRNIEQLEKEFGSSPSALHREVESVKQYIYEHYSEELSVDALARNVYMAPSYLSHVFKKETGQNISKFIKTYRMEKARELLEDTHNKIVAVSSAVGYPNVSYFCQSFREYFGVSPQKYRNQGESDE